MGYICTRCGGTKVACEAIVNPNTREIIDYFDGSFVHAICRDCENEVIISNVEEVKHEIDLRFHEFLERTGKEPEYVECQIVWKETGNEQRKTIKLSLSINDDDNDDVFYYCSGSNMDWLFGCLGNENFYVCQPVSFYKSQQEIQKVNPLYAFKVATAYFREQGKVPVFEDSNCRLIKL